MHVPKKIVKTIFGHSVLYKIVLHKNVLHVHQIYQTKPWLITILVLYNASTRKHSMDWFFAKAFAIMHCSIHFSYF